MKILITILILFFPIIGELIGKLITQEWGDITDYLLMIPPFNIISAIKQYHGKENITINYNTIILQLGGIFIVSVLGTVGLIYIYKYFNNNIIETTTEIAGGGDIINKEFFNKFYI